jgi:hypothetical protein
MSEEDLRSEAARCRRWANQLNDRETVANLLQMADRLEAQANEIATALRENMAHRPAPNLQH